MFEMYTEAFVIFGTFGGFAVVRIAFMAHRYMWYKRRGLIADE